MENSKIKEFKYRKKYSYIIKTNTVRIISIVLSLILLFSGCGTYNAKLQDKIKLYVDNKNVNNEVLCQLSLFTDFEWDKVVIYKHPSTADEIYKTAGVKYEPKDLSSGWFFVLDGEIVYEEIFETNFESLPQFFVYPYHDINNEKHCNSFDKDSAIFICNTLESDNKIGYSLYPINI